jgi:hypothetical protein
MSKRNKKQKKPAGETPLVLSAEEMNARGYFERKPVSYAVGEYLRRDLRAKQ